MAKAVELTAGTLAVDVEAKKLCCGLSRKPACAARRSSLLTLLIMDVRLSQLACKAPGAGISKGSGGLAY